MELTAAVLAYIMHGQVETMLIRTMNESLFMYEDNTNVKQAIDYLQSNVSWIVFDWIYAGYLKFMFVTSTDVRERENGKNFNQKEINKEKNF